VEVFFKGIILFDLQTSGGLLIAVSEDKALWLIDRLHEAGISEAALIGEVVGSLKDRIIVESAQ
jgi:selenide, water dikinase